MIIPGPILFGAAFAGAVTVAGISFSFDATLLILSAFACLAFTGVIGFIDLMAPHIYRMITGNDYRYLLPASAMMGALILLVSDTTAHNLFSPVEIPVGVTM